MIKYYYYYVQALFAKAQAYFVIKGNERKLNECWRKILQHKDEWDSDKLAEVTERALKCQNDLDKSWALFHEIYNF